MDEDLGQERQERATPKRVREARERGMVPRSRELSATLLLLCGGGCLLLLGAHFVQALRGVMGAQLALGRAQIFDAGAMQAALLAAAGGAFGAFLPLLLALVAVAVLAPLAFGGWTFSSQALTFQWERVDPLQGLKRMVSARGWLELGKALVKFALLAAVTVLLLRHHARAIVALGSEPLPQAFVHAGQILAWSFLALCAALALIAAFDVPFQQWDYARQLRMTRQELREESKETEGHQEVRGKIRKLQRRLAQSRMMAEVPKADVILTNPTHVAVALRYDAARMRAPRVVAKGAELIAAQIRRIGAEHKIPVVSTPPLARALYHGTELNDEIPVGLYLAVAQVLAYVHQLRAGVAGAVPPAIDVPAEFRKE